MAGDRVARCIGVILGSAVPFLRVSVKDPNRYNGLAEIFNLQIRSGKASSDSQRYWQQIQPTPPVLLKVITRSSHPRCPDARLHGRIFWCGNKNLGCPTIATPVNFFSRFSLSSVQYVPAYQNLWVAFAESYGKYQLQLYKNSVRVYKQMYSGKWISILSKKSMSRFMQLL